MSLLKTSSLEIQFKLSTFAFGSVWKATICIKNSHFFAPTLEDTHVLMGPEDLKKEKKLYKEILSWVSKSIPLQGI